MNDPGVANALANTTLLLDSAGDGTVIRHDGQLYLAIRYDDRILWERFAYASEACTSDVMASIIAKGDTPIVYGRVDGLDNA